MNIMKILKYNQSLHGTQTPPASELNVIKAKYGIVTNMGKALNLDFHNEARPGTISEV